MKLIKGNGYLLEVRQEGKIKLYRWTGEFKEQGNRTAAANKAKNFIEKPKYCPITGLSNRGTREYVMDHRDGRMVMEENDINPELVTEENADKLFMWVHPTGNATKRQACKRCSVTGDKDPARVCGVIIKQGKYEGSCEGCFWADPTGFVSKLLHKNI